ncbi:MAG: hypothetical protein ACTSRD_05395 [Promethearchaeota archaeon]
MVNLIPETPSNAPNYWCTWGMQNYIFGQGDESFNLAELEGERGALHARNNLTEELLIGDHGWLSEIYQEVRQDLIVILDDGWDLPLLEVPELELKNTSEFRDTIKFLTNMLEIRKYLSSYYLHSDRFPSGQGLPEHRLKFLNDKVKALGWKGIGLWVAAQEATNFRKKFDLSRKKYWNERGEWSKHADIHYWKIDWGIKMHNFPFRKFLTTVGKNHDVFVEHAHPRGPFNNKFGDGLTSKKYIKNALKLLEWSDVYRTYDVSPYLSAPTTLDRVARILINSTTKGSGRQLLNCEEELYVGAALGCAIGVMRHPYIGLRTRNGKELDFGMQGPRNYKRRIDEVIRSLRYHRIAPPFATSSNVTQISSEVLYDSWDFEPGDFWDKSVLGKTVKQGAPTIVARGIELPDVKVNGTKPYVIACRNPNSAVSVATLGRIANDKEYYTPRADISLPLTNDVKFIGVFGHYNSLTLLFDPTREISEIWAQDLKGDEAMEISKRVDKQDRSVTFSGDLLEEIGLQNASKDDVSDPGLVMKIM